MAGSNFRGLALSLCVSIAACGGGGTEETALAAPPAPPVAPAAPICTPKVVTVQLFGDSTMYSYDSFTLQRAVPTVTQDLQADMDARFGAGAVNVTENIVLRGTTAQVLAGQNDYSPWPKSVVADIVVMNFGINDQDPGAAESVDQYEANLRLMAKLWPGVIVFETPNPGPAPWVSPTAINGGYAAYAQRMREVAASLNAPVADTQAYVQTVPDWMSYFNDGAHPSAAMYALIAKNSITPVLADQVAKIRGCGA